MSILLHVQSSILFHHSVSRQLSAEFVARWIAGHPGTVVEELDLAADPLPHFGADNVGAIALPAEQQTPPMKAAAALSERLIAQIERASVIVIGSPMYNFSVCTQLKAWFDHIIIAGRTFRYTTQPKGAVGLLSGKKVFVIEARGANYADAPMSAFDFQEPLIRTNLNFIGLGDVRFIRAEGMRQVPEEAASIVGNALEVVRREAA